MTKGGDSVPAQCEVQRVRGGTLKTEQHVDGELFCSFMDKHEPYGTTTPPRFSSGTALSHTQTFMKTTKLDM